MAGDRSRQLFKNEEGASDMRRWQCQLPKGAAHGDAVQSRIHEMNREGDVVSARMRLLYDYRAPAGTRWSPTAEQLRELLALFHVGGLRTPSTAQISRITARLRAHGRIEGRNVFYWFQNQKARERKRRLQLMQAPATARPSEISAASSMDGEPLSLTPQVPHAEALQTMMMHVHEQLQPKGCCLGEAHFKVGGSSSGASTPEDIDCAVPLHHLWPNYEYRQASADKPLAVVECIVQQEEDKMFLNLQNHELAGSIMSNSRSITRVKHTQLGSAVAQASLIEEIAAEDEKSEVSDANVQHSASPFPNFLWYADKMQCSSRIGDEIGSVVAAPETLMGQVQVPGSHESSQSSERRCLLPALNLFPLSPTSSSHHHYHNFLSSSMHGQNEDSKSTGLSQSLCMQSSLLDLKLAIDS